MIDSEKLPKEFIYMDDFSGEYSLATACLTGEYIPANQDHPAYSAPIRIMIIRGNQQLALFGSFSIISIITPAKIMRF